MNFHECIISWQVLQFLQLAVDFTPISQALFLTELMRKRTGSLLPFIASSAVGFVFLATLFVNSFVYVLAQEKANVACESAALSAATDISRIVVKESRLGYVSLTNWPSGAATKNAAGEPMPIVGINTWIATCRESLLIARKLNNETMTELALADLAACKHATQLLNQACEEALAPNSSRRPTDRDGLEINAYAQAKQSFEATAPFLSEYTELRKLNMQLGWLDGYASSGVNLPAAPALAEVSDEQYSSGQYNAFRSIPVQKQDFFFAGFAEHTSLCSRSKFRSVDMGVAKPCSAVLVSATIANSNLKNATQNSGASVPGSFVSGSSAALPAMNPDLTVPPMFVLSFPNGMSEQSFSLARILKENALLSAPAEIQKSAGGDYPDDQNACLVDDSELKHLTFADLGAKGIHDWLRASRGKIRIESLLDRLNEPFSESGKDDPRKVYVLTVDPSGMVQTSTTKEFSSETILDGQNLAIAYDVEIGDAKWTVSMRDQVSNLSLSDCKHAGRPLQDKQSEGLIETIYPRDGLAVALQFAAPH